MARKSSGDRGAGEAGGEQDDDEAASEEAEREAEVALCRAGAGAAGALCGGGDEDCSFSPGSRSASQSERDS